MLSAIYFIPYIDDISQLSSFTPGSKAYKEAISAIKKAAKIPPDDFPEVIKRWNKLQTTAVLIDLIVFIDIILFAL